MKGIGFVWYTVQRKKSPAEWRVNHSDPVVVAVVVCCFVCLLLLLLFYESFQNGDMGDMTGRSNPEFKLDG